jgi:hypothetical protein
MEAFPRIIIVDTRQPFGPSSETRWQCKVLAIQNVPFDMMEDVEGLLHASSHLLDAGELAHVLELVFAILDIFPFLVKGHPFLA